MYITSKICRAPCVHNKHKRNVNEMFSTKYEVVARSFTRRLRDGRAQLTWLTNGQKAFRRSANLPLIQVAADEVFDVADL